MVSNFVIICGLPRSGTRQFTDYINKVTGFNIQGEISEKLIKSAVSLVEDADSVYVTSKYGAHWRKNRSFLVPALFTLLQKGAVVDDSSSRFVGFKTPYIETYRRELRRLILPSFDMLYWLYCVRDFEDCYRSLLGMPWFNRTSSSFVYKYCYSLNAAVDIKRGLSGTTEKISVLNLSSYINSTDKAQWLLNNMFHKLEVDLNREDILAVVEGTNNRNSSSNRFGIDKPPLISDQDRKIFSEQEARINKAISKFNDTFEESLSPVSY